MTQSNSLTIGSTTFSSETSSDQKMKNKSIAESNNMRGWIVTKLSQLAQPSVAGPVILACLCAALAQRKWGYWRKEAPRAPPPRKLLQRSMSIAKLHGGDVALQRMNDLKEARIDDQASLKDATMSFRSLLSKELYSFSELQRVAAKLEMSGKEDEAIAMLQKAFEKEDKKGKAHEAYELQMLLVEMLIYKGDLQRALQCKCLNEEQISDARRPLYKAVISGINNDRESAKKFYKEFEEIRSHFHSKDAEGEGSPLYGLVYDFESFERVVKDLKKEIDTVQKSKTISK